MKSTLMYKIVRNRIPELMLEQGLEIGVRKATGKELSSLLMDKIREEMNELFENPSAEECADVIEAVFCFAESHGIPFEEVFGAGDRKRAEKGSFSKGYYVTSVYAKDGDDL